MPTTDQVSKDIETKIRATNTLSAIQKAHLRAPSTIKAISEETLTMDQAIARSSDTAIDALKAEKIDGLRSTQIQGIKMGLTVEDVNYPTFGSTQLWAHQKGHPPEFAKGLTTHQTNARIMKGYSREDVEGLNYWQCIGLQRDLTPSQVNHHWFDENAIKALNDGRFDQYAARQLAQENSPLAGNTTVLSSTGRIYSGPSSDLSALQELSDVKPVLSTHK